MSLEEIDKILDSPDTGASDLEVIETLATIYEDIAQKLGVECLNGMFNYNYAVHQGVAQILIDRKILPVTELGSAT